MCISGAKNLGGPSEFFLPQMALWYLCKGKNNASFLPYEMLPRNTKDSETQIFLFSISPMLKSEFYILISVA